MHLNPFRTGRGLSTEWLERQADSLNRSQSLWNRAGSFDTCEGSCCSRFWVSIPLEQGGVFRLRHFWLVRLLAKSQSLWNRAGSFDEKLKALDELLGSLNPFGTGRGLSTIVKLAKSKGFSVSIPLEQGGVFRLQGWFGALVDKA